VIQTVVRYIIDLVRDDLQIEIHSRHLYAPRPKLRANLNRMMETSE
jgi:hypothetical protein